MNGLPDSTAPARKKKVPEVPVLLTPADAMLWAAGQLEQQLNGLELIGLMREHMSDLSTGLDAESRESLARLKQISAQVVDLDLQKNALRGAAAAIKEAANEMKLADARAAARGIRP